MLHKMGINEKFLNIFADGEKGGFVADLVKFLKKLQPYGHAIFYAICRLVTIHLYKAVYIGAVYVITREVRIGTDSD